MKAIISAEQDEKMMLFKIQRLLLRYLLRQSNDAGIVNKNINFFLSFFNIKMNVRLMFFGFVTPI